MADTYRLLLDENIEHEVMERLTDAGHNVEHVDTVAKLRKGARDTELAAYSVAADRAIVTYGDDFIEDVPPTEYRAALFFEDDTLTAREIAAIIHAMSELYPSEEVVGLQKPAANGFDFRPRLRPWAFASLFYKQPIIATYSICPRRDGRLNRGPVGRVRKPSRRRFIPSRGVQRASACPG